MKRLKYIKLSLPIHKCFDAIEKSYAYVNLDNKVPGEGFSILFYISCPF